MTFRHHERQLRRAQFALQRCCSLLELQALLLTMLEVPHGLQRARSQ